MRIERTHLVVKWSSTEDTLWCADRLLKHGCHWSLNRTSKFISSAHEELYCSLFESSFQYTRPKHNPSEKETLMEDKDREMQYQKPSFSYQRHALVRSTTFLCLWESAHNSVLIKGLGKIHTKTKRMFCFPWNRPLTLISYSCCCYCWSTSINSTVS